MLGAIALYLFKSTIWTPSPRFYAQTLHLNPPRNDEREQHLPSKKM